MKGSLVAFATVVALVSAAPGSADLPSVAWEAPSPAAGSVMTVFTCATPARVSVNLESPILNALSLIRTSWYFTVDPYWYFRDFELIGFNSNKPKASGNERLVKAALMARLKPGAVIVGNSAAEIGLPPTHRGFTEGGTLAPFNLAAPSATWSP